MIFSTNAKIREKLCSTLCSTEKQRSVTLWNTVKVLKCAVWIISVDFSEKFEGGKKKQIRL